LKMLIDTNVYTNALKGNKEVVAVLRRAQKIAISSVSIGELLAGFKKGNREQANREELNDFLDSPRVIIHRVDEETAEFYADIVNRLQQQGTPIPTNDIWIAATAFQYGLRLFTRDSHFAKVAGLILVA